MRLRVGSRRFMLKSNSLIVWQLSHAITNHWCLVTRAAAMVGQNHAVLPAASRALNSSTVASASASAEITRPWGAPKAQGTVAGRWTRLIERGPCLISRSSASSSSIVIVAERPHARLENRRAPIAVDEPS